VAGIEKICEFSDFYPGWDMYRYKRNLIQIMPEHRKKFRGAKATLVIKKVEINEVSFMSKNGYCYSSPDEYELADYFDFDVTTYMEYQRVVKGQRFIAFYDYLLVVEDEHLQGMVRGKYWNSSKDIATVKRKLKRMIGPGLRIVNEVGSRSEVFANWKKEFVAAARSYHEREEAKEAAQKMAADMQPVEVSPEEQEALRARLAHIVEVASNAMA
jgi:hypothetical protein